MYRFYVNDPVRFQKSIRVTVEHGHANNFENDYTSTAFWYQKDPHKAFPLMAGAQDRLPGWPMGVNEALKKEAQVGFQLATMMTTGKSHLTEQDGKLLQSLVADANKSFREFRYQDYIRDVLAEEALLNRYAPTNP